MKLTARQRVSLKIPFDPRDDWPTIEQYCQGRPRFVRVPDWWRPRHRRFDRRRRDEHTTKDIGLKGHVVGDMIKPDADVIGREPTPPREP